MSALKTDKSTAWPRTIAEARAVQEALRGRVVATDRIGKVSHVAGVDVGFKQDGAVTRAAVVVLSFPGLKPVEHAVVRTRAGVKPVYVSIGHRIRLETAIEYVLRCTTKYRLPETTRAAHRLVSGA